MAEDEDWEDEDTVDELATDLYHLLKGKLAQYPEGQQEDVLDRLAFRLTHERDD